MLDLRRRSVFHTTGFKCSRGAAVTLIVRVIGFVEVLKTHVQHDTVNDKSTLRSFGHYVVQITSGLNEAFAAVGSALFLARLDAGDVFERVALREVSIPATFEGNEVGDFNVTGVGVTEEVAFTDTNGSAVFLVLLDDVEHGLDIFLCRCRRETVSTAGSAVFAHVIHFACSLQTLQVGGNKEHRCQHEDRE